MYRDFYKMELGYLETLLLLRLLGDTVENTKAAYESELDPLRGSHLAEQHRRYNDLLELIKAQLERE